MSPHAWMHPIFCTIIFRSHTNSTTTLGCCMVVNNQNLIRILLYSAQTWWYTSHRIISSSSHSFSWEFIVAKGFFIIIIATVVLLLLLFGIMILYFVNMNMDMFICERGYENNSIGREREKFLQQPLHTSRSSHQISR